MGAAVAHRLEQLLELTTLAVANPQSKGAEPGSFPPGSGLAH